MGKCYLYTDGSVFGSAGISAVISSIGLGGGVVAIV